MIREVKSSDLESIARLHSDSFENHFLPKLGIELLTNYYKEFIDEKNIFIVSTDESNTINGIVLGTPDSAVGRNQFIQKHKLKLAFRVALLCIKFDKETWDRVVSFVKNRVNLQILRRDITNLTKSPSNKTLSLLSICVSRNARGMGVAKLLIEEFEKTVTNNGYIGYTLTVHKNNHRANSFYKKIGMSIYKESDSEYKYFKNI